LQDFHFPALLLPFNAAADAQTDKNSDDTDGENDPEYNNHA
jgi:hypothetical protein